LEVTKVLENTFVFDFDYFDAKENSLSGNANYHQYFSDQFVLYEEDFQPKGNEVQEDEAVELEDEVLFS
jgi:hypothetical protein